MTFLKRNSVEQMSPPLRLRIFCQVSRAWAAFLGYAVIFYCYFFELPDMQKHIATSFVWMFGLIFMAFFYLLSPSFIIKHFFIKVMAYGVYVIFFILVCVSAYHCFFSIVPKSVLLLDGGRIEAGSARIWVLVFFSSLGIGSLCGFFNILLISSSTTRQV